MSANNEELRAELVDAQVNLNFAVERFQKAEAEPRAVDRGHDDGRFRNTRCGNCDHFYSRYYFKPGKCSKHKRYVRRSTSDRPCFTPRPDAPTVIVIGLDPGAQTGIALLSPDGLVCQTVKWGLDGSAVYEVLRPLVLTARGADGRGNAVAVVEVSGRHYRPRGVSQRAEYKIAQNVGECAAKAAALVGFLRGLGLEVTERRPLPGRTKRGLTVPMWRAMFPDYQGRTPSSLARDAACLADHEYRIRRFPGETMSKEAKP